MKINIIIIIVFSFFTFSCTDYEKQEKLLVKDYSDKIQLLNYIRELKTDTVEDRFTISKFPKDHHIIYYYYKNCESLPIDIFDENKKIRIRNTLIELNINEVFYFKSRIDIDLHACNEFGERIYLRYIPEGDSIASVHKNRHTLIKDNWYLYSPTYDFYLFSCKNGKIKYNEPPLPVVQNDFWSLFK